MLAKLSLLPSFCGYGNFWISLETAWAGGRFNALGQDLKFYFFLICAQFGVFCLSKFTELCSHHHDVVLEQL